MESNTDRHKPGSPVPEPSILANKQYFKKIKRQGKGKVRIKGNTTNEKNKNKNTK